MKRSATFHAAIAYAQAGSSVFPCKAKKPLTPNGFKDATRDEKQIYEWWSKDPDAQVALPTGEQNGLLVLDADNPEATEYIKKLNLPETKTIQTRQGRWQLWFKQPQGTTTKCSTSELAPGLDVRGDGGYVIAPPSVHHESGQPYKVVRDLPLAEFPPELLPLVADHRQPIPEANTAGPQLTPGTRRPKLFKIACSMRKQGLDVDSICSALRNIPCNPPLPEAEIRKLAEGSTRYDVQGQAPEETTELEMQSFSNVKLEKVQWLWPGRIASGKLNLFCGDPEKGKSLVSIDLAARVSQGIDFADGAKCPQGDVLMVSCEDDASDTVGPRLHHAGAVLDRIHRIKAVKVTLSDGSTGQSFFSLERDLPKLEAALEKFPDLRLIIIDPVAAFMGKVDTHKDAEVRAVLGPLADFAAAKRIAVVGIMHLRKSDAAAMLRVSGSIGFVAASRVVWGFGPDPVIPDRQIMVCVKNNLGPKAVALAYKIVGSPRDSDIGIIEWLSDRVTATADEVLDSSPKRARQHGSIEDAEDWLKTVLADGPVPSQRIEDLAANQNFSWRTVNSAKQQLGVKAKKAGFGGGWMWTLPSEGRNNATQG
jgi:hypothetical protein